MGLTPMVPDIAHDPIAIGLFGAIGVMVIPQDLSNLIHEPEFRIWSEFFCIFHAINAMMQYMEKSIGIFPYFIYQYDNRWNFFHDI